MKKKRILSLLLACLMLLPFAGCVQDKGDGETDRTPEVVLNLITGKESDYVVVYSATDTVGKKLADRIWQLIKTQYGITLKIRDDTSAYEHEILVGNTSRDATKRLRSTLSTGSDFCMSVDGDDLVLLFTDSSMGERMYLMLEKMMTEQSASGNFVFTDLDHYLYSANPNAAIKGDSAVLVENKASAFTIVYSASQDGGRESAAYLSRRIKQKTGVSIPVKTDDVKYEKEITVGSAVNRPGVQTANAMMDTADDFAIRVSEACVTVTGRDNESLFMAMMKLVSLVGDGATYFALTEADNYVYSVFGKDFTVDMAQFITEYQKVHNTHSSSYANLYDNVMSMLDKSDHELVLAMVERMGNSAAVYVGSSSVLYQGYKQKLDTSDYSKVTKVSFGKVWIPAEFAEKYFGKELTKNAEGYVDLTTLCEGESAYSLYYESATGLAIITPEDVVSFSEAGKINGYTNQQYADRMVQFFNDSKLPEPKNNSEQSRVEIDSRPYNHEVPDYRTKIYQGCSSPSITTVMENGKEVLYVTYEIVDTKHTLEELTSLVYIKKSTDNGKTWTEVGTVPNLRWATATTVHNEVWLFGNHVHTAEIMLAHVKADGTVESKTLFDKKNGGSSPCAVLIHNGRIYKGYNNLTISADINSDFMNPDSWTVSNLLSSVADVLWLRQASGNDQIAYVQVQECNLVLVPDGSIYNIMRVEGMITDAWGNPKNVLETGKAAMVKLSADGKTHSDPVLLDFPTSVTKFSIKYDEATGLYICLTNIHTGAKLKNQRTVMAIAVSKDLIHWDVKDYLLVERELMNFNASAYHHGWQYPDFVIVGENLYYVVRESSGDSNDWHTGNYLTFYTLSDYKNVIA